MSYWKSEADWLDWIEMGACGERERARARERASERVGERASERASERERETAALGLYCCECR